MSLLVRQYAYSPRWPVGRLPCEAPKIVGMDSHEDRQVIKALAPMSEIQKYSTDLRSMTSGEGSYTIRFDHLDVVPNQVAKKSTTS